MEALQKNRLAASSICSHLSIRFLPFLVLSAPVNQTEPHPSNSPEPNNSSRGYCRTAQLLWSCINLHSILCTSGRKSMQTSFHSGAAIKQTGLAFSGAFFVVIGGFVVVVVEENNKKGAEFSRACIIQQFSTPDDHSKI